MPIKDIIVDWGNNHPPAGNNSGKYKNRKPYCQVTAETPVASCVGDRNITCAGRQDDGWCSTVRNRQNDQCNDAGGTLFGNSYDACDPGYYEFIGAYAFDSTDTGPNGKCGYTIGGRSPADMAAADVSKLTSQYGLKPGDRYCAFKPRVIIIDNWGWCNGSCADGGCWGSDDEGDDNPCTDSNLAVYRNAGTPFAGWVIVAEQK